jgi:hypothetical protein
MHSKHTEAYNISLMAGDSDLHQQNVMRILER